MKKVFLGGTCNDSTWRERLIESLKIDYFNPVVEDWNDEARKNEIHEREHCDFCLYVITPKMEGYYSIAEVVDDSNKRPAKTILCILNEDYDWEQHEFVLRDMRIAKECPDDALLYEHSNEWEWGHPYTWCGDRPYSFNAIEDLVQNNGAKVFNTLEGVANYLNKTREM